MRDLYFDYNATTPVAPEVREAILPFLGPAFGNPSSGHSWGLQAKEAVNDARKRVARLINAEPDEIYFTACATESNNLVIQGVMGQGGRMLTSAVEHPAVLEPARVCEDRGAALTVVPVDSDGVVDPDAVAGLLAPGARLVSVMLANNESGAIQPVWDLAPACIASGALLHADAAQAVGKIPVDVRALGVDFLTIAGHKLYAPKGVGALYVRRGVELPPLCFGGGQERALRPGTENVALIAGLGAACELAAHGLEEEMARQRRLGDILLDGLGRLGVALTVHGEHARRLPNTLFVNFGGYEAPRLLESAALAGIGLSAGAACHGPQAGRLSHVLEAMGVPQERGAGTLRLSWGRYTTEEHVLELISRLPDVLRRSR
jgi:cysteine desulfurase